MKWLNSKLLIALALLLILSTGAYILSAQAKKTELSGTVEINGIIPPNAVVTVWARSEGQKDFQSIASGLTAVDQGTWEWNEAKQGTVYELKAELTQEGSSYGVSPVASVTAPSTTQKLNITSSFQDKTNPPNPYGPITGNIDLNGAVGPQSYIALYQKKPGETDFQLVTDQIAATDGIGWEFPAAVAGQTYEMKAVLNVNGIDSGESAVLQVTAPASNEFLKINSTYQAPPVKASISGSVVINGPINSQSTVTLFAQGPGDSALKPVLTGINAVNGVTWTWSNAIQGYSYMLKASVMLNGADQGDSQVITVTAPASNEVVTINLGANGSPTLQPVNSPTAQCVSQNNGVWTVNLNYQSVPSANSYWLQVGSTYQAADILNTRVQWAGQGNQIYTVNTIKNATTYFVQYAASTCANCSTIGQFSQFSNTLQFSCPTQPTATPTSVPPPTYTPYPTYTPFPTNTPTPTSTPAPTATPTSTPTPTILLQN